MGGTSSCLRGVQCCGGALGRNRLPGQFFPLGGFTPVQSTALSNVAATLGATSMQVALAWLLERAPNILLIPGTSSVAYLRENLAPGDLNLPDDAKALLDRIALERCRPDARYPGEALTRSMAVELGSRRIAANVVTPGAIAPDLSGGIVRNNPKVDEAIAGHTALGRAGVADDVGPLIAGLLLDDSAGCHMRRTAG